MGIQQWDLLVLMYTIPPRSCQNDLAIEWLNEVADEAPAQICYYVWMSTTLKDAIYMLNSRPMYGAVSSINRYHESKKQDVKVKVFTCLPSLFLIHSPGPCNTELCKGLWRSCLSKWLTSPIVPTTISIDFILWLLPGHSELMPRNQQKPRRVPDLKRLVPGYHQETQLLLPNGE